MKTISKINTIANLILFLVIIGIFTAIYLERRAEAKNEVKNCGILQSYFPKVHTLSRGEKYLTVDRQGNIHLINYNPYTDEIVIEYGEITEAITTKDVINVIR